MSELTVRPVGYVTSTRTQRLDDDWGTVESSIGLDDERFTAEALAGLEGFSHVEVIFLFDGLDETEIAVGARHPRGNEKQPRVGIFAQRASSHPNRLGLTTCEMLAVHGLEIRVRGLDAIDGMPVLDIKPYLREFGPRGPVTQPAWSSPLMAGYWSSVPGLTSRIRPSPAR